MERLNFQQIAREIRVLFQKSTADTEIKNETNSPDIFFCFRFRFFKTH